MDDRPAALSPVETPTVAPPAGRRALRVLAWPFVGRHGLRGGWRLFVYFFLFGAATGAVERVWPHSARSGELLALPVLGREAVMLLIVLAVTLLLGLFEKRTLGDYGLPLRPDRPRVAWGLGIGFAAATALLVVLAAAGAFRARPALTPAAIVPSALLWGLVFVLVGFFEELMLRGYPQATLARSIGFWPAAVILSVLFAALHMRNPGETPLGLVAVVGFGLFLSYTLRVTGNLWMAVGFHASWDWAESFFYGVPNSGMRAAGHLLDGTFSGPAWLSGGTAGPEGSVLVYAALLGSALVVRRAESAYRSEVAAARAQTSSGPG
jgi:membrane protease YdiL (CAAX protease family)